VTTGVVSRRNAPLLALGLVTLAAIGLELYIARNLTFYQDTWAFLLDRRSFSVDSLLVPHNEHIVLIPVLLQQLLLNLFGMTSAWPEYVLLALMEGATAVLLFVYVRRRTGAWVALAFATLLLFIGPAWETLLWPFEICFVGSILFGIAMLLALEREDQRGDILACAFLLIAIGFNSLGLAFAVGAAVDVSLRRRERGWSRAYLVGIPLLLYAGWYLGWGHEAGNSITLDSAFAAPRYVLDCFAVALQSLLGLSSAIPGKKVPDPSWGRALAVGFFGLVAFGLWRRPRIDQRLWPALAIALTYWTLAGLNQSIARQPTTSRYIYATAAVTLLIAANLPWGVRFGKRALVVVGVVTAVAVFSNLGIMRDGASYLRNQAVLTKADLGAVEIARPSINPAFRPNGPSAGTGGLINVEAGKYFEAIDEYGSPAYTADELTSAPAPAAHYADLVLATALEFSTETELGTYSASGGAGSCVDFEGAELALTPGTTQIEVAPGPHADFSLRRFSTNEYPVSTEGAPGDSTTRLLIRPDSAPQPWYLQVEAQQPVRVCHLNPGK